MKYIIVMGHTHCGGIRAFSEHRNRLNLGDFIDNWMSLIAPAADALGEAGDEPDYLSRLEQASIVATMDNLMTFPWIKSRVEDRQLELLGAYFDVGTGDLTVYDPATRAFAPVAWRDPAAPCRAGRSEAYAPNGSSRRRARIERAQSRAAMRTDAGHWHRLAPLPARSGAAAAACRPDPATSPTRSRKLCVIEIVFSDTATLTLACARDAF